MSQTIRQPTSFAALAALAFISAAAGAFIFDGGDAQATDNPSALLLPVVNSVGTTPMVLDCGATVPSMRAVQNNSSVTIYVGISDTMTTTTGSFVVKADAAPIVLGRNTIYVRAASGAANDVRCIPWKQ